MSGPLVADSFISLAALGGLVALIGAIRSFDAESPLLRRVLFGLRLLAALMVVRVLAWWTDLALFNAATLALAGLVPLATVLLTEGMLRRHAPPLTKAIAAGGAATFIFLSLLPESLAEPWRLMALFAYQLVTFSLAGLMAVRRDRTSLSAAENQAVDRIALSLLLILPLFATDFRSPYLDLPVRLGGVAILFLCWLLISLGQRTVSHRDTMTAFGILLLTALCGAWAIGLDSRLEGGPMIRAASVVLSAALLGVIWKDSISLRAEQNRESLLRHLAEDRIDNTTDFLSQLRRHPLVDGALLLGERELADVDPASLRQLLAERPMIRASEIDRYGETEAELITWLLDKYEATHLMLVSRQPLQVIALNMPSVTATPTAETELKIVQRMALLIAERSPTHA